MIGTISVLSSNLHFGLVSPVVLELFISTICEMLEQADRYYSIVLDQEDGAMDSNGAIRVPCKVLDDRSGY
jgi:hypothetical protein